MNFEFAKATNVTEFAKTFAEKKGHLKGDYELFEKIYICADVHDAWVLKILDGHNIDYDKDNEKTLLEICKVEDKGVRMKKLCDSAEMYTEVVLEEEFLGNSGWDVQEHDSIDEAVEAVDEGYGIN